MAGRGPAAFAPPPAPWPSLCLAPGGAHCGAPGELRGGEGWRAADPQI